MGVKTMKTIKKIIETTDIEMRTFQITFDDETTFEFELFDNEDFGWSLSGEDRARYSEIELREILSIIERLNKK
jgi:hypothetical protein